VLPVAAAAAAVMRSPTWRQLLLLPGCQEGRVYHRHHPLEGRLLLLLLLLLMVALHASRRDCAVLGRRC
jgi:hypothetical protein